MKDAQCPNPTCKSIKGFETNNSTISGYPFPLPLIQCKSCGTVIGTTLYPDTAANIKKLLFLLEPENSSFKSLPIKNNKQIV